ncbi:hypothetical protein FRB94_013212 [Tulasnella sp. JGI-2019a]|nr:hypothetical protein FRB94_013212 [Tulasnella sp. JGI-2019a]
MSNPNKFRILLVGRGNAGKTTILKTLCGRTETPVVRDGHGHLVSPPDSLNPTIGRGDHDIEYEITYRTKPNFVFHDSCGLESGSGVEMRKIVDFIASRQGLHFVWVCIPLDDERPALSLFDLHAGDIGMIFVFTKYDGLEAKILGVLRRQGLGLRQARSALEDTAENVFQEQWLPLLKAPNPPPPPPHYVRLKDLHKPDQHCDELIQRTEDVLKDNPPLFQMFNHAVGYQLERRLRDVILRALEHLLQHSSRGVDQMRNELVESVLSRMPHVYFPNPVQGVRIAISSYRQYYSSISSSLLHASAALVCYISLSPNP